MSASYVTKNLSFKLEVKSDHNDDIDFITVDGVASTFGNIDLTGDIIERGAFKSTIKLMKAGKREIAMLNQHRIAEPIGFVESLKEVDDKLIMRAKFVRENFHVKNVLPMLKGGKVLTLSIGFNIIDSENLDNGNRIIKEIDLREISMVTMAANEEAEITSVKKDEENPVDKDEKIIDAEKAESVSTKKEYEQMLKDTGMFTKKATMYLASKFTENSKRSDSAEGEKKRSDSVSDEDIIKSMQDFIGSLKK